MVRSMEKINHGPHVSVFISHNNFPSVMTDDYELFDFVDDYLTEDCDYELESFIYHDHPAPGFFTMELISGINFHELIISIKQLDLSVIERIYIVNNP